MRGDGQGRVNLEFASHLLDAGHSVALFADKVDEELVSLGAVWVPVHPGFQSNDLLKVWRFRRLATRALLPRLSQFDAIVACGVVLDVQHDLNIAHFVHGTWLRSEYHASKIQKGIGAAYQWLFSFLNARWEREVFSKAQKAGAVSRMVADELVEIGVSPEKVVVLGNGVDLDEFHPGDADRGQLGLPAGPPLALFVGDIRYPIKNLDAVLTAMVNVKDLHLAVAGRVTNSPYPALAARLGVADRVHFLDFRRDIADLMRASDFFVLVSRRDSCPLVVLEALASGLPVVTAKTVGNSDLVEDCCGYVIETPDSLDQLARALVRLTEDEVLRQRFARAARLRAMENSWKAMSERYMHSLDMLQPEGLGVGSQ